MQRWEHPELRSALQSSRTVCLIFEGYDVKGHKIDKIPMITNELISGIVKEHNEKYGTWRCGNEDGILHYYHVGTDTGGKEFLKEVTDPEAIEKKEYALAIGTMYIEEENREKVNVRIRPGYKFSFEVWIGYSASCMSMMILKKCSTV